MKLPDTLPAPELALDLRKPLSIRGGTLAMLKLREPSAAEVWKAEAHIQNDAGPEAVTLYLRELTAQVCGIARAEDLDEVPTGILGQAGEYFSGFTEAGLEPAEIGLDAVAQPEQWDLELPKPVSFQGIEYATLMLTEPLTGIVRKAQGHLRKGIGPQSLRSYQLWLVSGTAGVPYQVVQALPVSTLNAAALYLQGFIGPGRRTGTS